MEQSTEKVNSHRVATSDDIEVSTYLEISKEMQGLQAAPKAGEIPHGAKEAVAIIDFGSQYTQLIARRVRELNVFCDIHPYNKYPKDIPGLKGVILSGSPFSVRDQNAPSPDLEGIKGVIPVLGVCYGAQYLVHSSGGEVAPSKIREYGRANLGFIDQTCRLVRGMAQGTQVWMSHADTILNAPASFKITGSTTDVEYAAFKIRGEETYGIQFHPEVYHTTEGQHLLKNFIVDICKTSQSWTPDSFVDSTIRELKNKLGNDKVILGLSGGVDSTVAAVLLNRSIGKNLYNLLIITQKIFLNLSFIF